MAGLAIHSVAVSSVPRDCNGHVADFRSRSLKTGGHQEQPWGYSQSDRWDSRIDKVSPWLYPESTIGPLLLNNQSTPGWVPPQSIKLHVHHHDHAQHQRYHYHHHHKQHHDDSHQHQHQHQHQHHQQHQHQRQHQHQHQHLYDNHLQAYHHQDQDQDQDPHDKHQQHHHDDHRQGAFWSVQDCSHDEVLNRIKSLCKEGNLDRAIDGLLHKNHHGVVPPEDLYRSLLNACNKKKALAHAKLVHAHLALHGLQSTIFSSKFLVSTLAKCGGLEDAFQVFCSLPHQTVFSWTAMITGYCDSGKVHDALKMYQCMQDDGVEPNEFTFVSLLKACGSTSDLEKGEALHADARRKGFHLDVFVGSTLISMYGKCGCLEEAENAFDGLSHRNSVSWNAMLSAYVEQGEGEKALKLYANMQEEGLRDTRTFVIAIQACCKLAENEGAVAVNDRWIKVISLNIAQALHAETRAKGFNLDVFVNSTLVSVYIECGSIVEAENAFTELSHHDVVSWTAMLLAYVDQCDGEKALQLYRHMQEQGTDPNARTLVISLQACCKLAEKEKGVIMDGQSIKITALRIGEALHGDVRKKGYGSDSFICSALVSMYGKCGSITGAEDVFVGLFQRDVVVWNAMLSAYVELGEEEKALRLYRHMEEEGPSPTERTFVVALQACCMFAQKEETVFLDGRLIKLKTLQVGRAIHADVCRKDFVSDVFVGNTLVSLYGKCGSIVEAENIFRGLFKRDMISWNAMLSAYVEQGEGEKGLLLYRQLQEEGVTPNVLTFVTALQACCMLAKKEEAGSVDKGLTKVMSLDIGQALHADALRKGLGSDSFLGSALLSMYRKCGSMADVENVAASMPQFDVVSWSAMLSAYVEQGQGEKALLLYKQMQDQGVSPNEWTFGSSLQACCMLAEKEEAVVMDGHWTKSMSLEIGEALHLDIRRMGLGSDAFVGNTLVSLYGKCGSIVQAEDVFNELPQRDVVSWTSMLSGYIEQAEEVNALQLYRQMQDEGLNSDDWTLVMAVQACCILAEKEEAGAVKGQSMKLVSLEIGRALHAAARRKDFDSNGFLGSILVSMYGKCGSIVEAENVLHGLSNHDVVSWSAMLSVYVEQGKGEKSLKLFRQMHDLGISPNERTFVIALQACCILAEKEESGIGLTKGASLEIGRAVHIDAQRKGFDSDASVASTLVCIYGKCGMITEAENVLREPSHCNILSWNAMLSVYIELGERERALEMYMQICDKGVTPNDITLLRVMQACSGIGSLEICREMHFASVSTENDLSLLITNTLIRAYGNCASMVDAQALFDALSEPDVVSWTALIAGYAGAGNCAASLQKFEDMKTAGIKPDGVTFLAVLSACSHVGLVNKGNQYFESMGKDYGIAPEIDHYVCMIDLLGRAGDFKKVEDMLSEMLVQPNMVFWLCLLSMCQKHGNVELGKQAFDSAVQLQPEHPVAYILMSNIYVDAGLWDSADEVDKFRQKEIEWDVPVQSWMEETGSFVAWDNKQSRQEQSYDRVATGGFTGLPLKLRGTG